MNKVEKELYKDKIWSTCATYTHRIIQLIQKSEMTDEDNIEYEKMIDYITTHTLYVEKLQNEMEVMITPT